MILKCKIKNFPLKFYYSLTIEHIRAKRSKPGLMQQHLTAVRAVAAVGQCEVDNVGVGSVRLDFCPVKVRGGDYLFDVGTAGSATLVLQTVLLITPVKKLANIELMERGAILEQKGTILLAGLPSHIAEREKKTLVKKTNWKEENIRIETFTDLAGPGNIVMLEVISENITEMFSGFGEFKVSAEAVASRAVNQYRDYLASEVPVDQYLADQLMLPLGVAAWQGSGTSLFRTHNLTQNSLTHIDILQRFLDIDIKTQNVNDRIIDVCLR